MKNVNKRYEELVLKNASLVRENEELRKKAAIPCNGCAFLLSQHIGDFYVCNKRGRVNPWEDFCSERKDGGPVF